MGLTSADEASEDFEGDEALRGYSLLGREGALVPSASRLGELVDDALDLREPYEAFRLVLSLKETLPELTEEELEEWGEEEPFVGDEAWGLLLAAVAGEVFEREELPHRPAWTLALEPLDAPWEPLESLSPGAGPFDSLNISLSFEDYHGI